MQHPEKNIPIPRTINAHGEWKLMSVNELPAFYTEGFVSENNAEDRKDEIRFGVHINGACVYLFTKEPHPDDQKRTCTYFLPMESLIHRSYEEIGYSQIRSTQEFTDEEKAHLKHCANTHP